MKLGNVAVFAFGLAAEAKVIRTPRERQSKNQSFLSKWFGNNCKGEDYRDQASDAVRPFRCQNKFDKYMIEWEKLEADFIKCGVFDVSTATTGKGKGRKRRDDDDDYDQEWAEFEAGDEANDQGIFDNELFDLTDDELAEIENAAADADANQKEQDLNYFDYFNKFKEDYEYEVLNDSSADEDNGKVRTIADLRAPEQRALSADPARAHRQLINAMKQYVKRFLHQCKNSDATLSRLTKAYKKAAELHAFVLSIVADKYQRMNERALRREQRL